MRRYLLLFQGIAKHLHSCNRKPTPLRVRASTCTVDECSWNLAILGTHQVKANTFFSSMSLSDTLFCHISSISFTFLLNLFVKRNGQSETCFKLCHGEKTRDEIQHHFIRVGKYTKFTRQQTILFKKNHILLIISEAYPAHGIPCAYPQAIYWPCIFCHPRLILSRKQLCCIFWKRTCFWILLLWFWFFRNQTQCSAKNAVSFPDAGIPAACTRWQRIFRRFILITP